MRCCLHTTSLERERLKAHESAKIMNQSARFRTHKQREYGCIQCNAHMSVQVSECNRFFLVRVFNLHTHPLTWNPHTLPLSQECKTRILSLYIKNQRKISDIVKICNENVGTIEQQSVMSIQDCRDRMVRPQDVRSVVFLLEHSCVVIIVSEQEYHSFTPGGCQGHSLVHMQSTDSTLS